MGRRIRMGFPRLRRQVFAFESWPPERRRVNIANPPEILSSLKAAVLGQADSHLLGNGSPSHVVTSPWGTAHFEHHGFWINAKFVKTLESSILQANEEKIEQNRGFFRLVNDFAPRFHSRQLSLKKWSEKEAQL